MEVGEYVRLKNGKIIKFTRFGTYRTHVRKVNGYYEYGTFENKAIYSGHYHYKYDDIVKHSKNIIDLIEVGDYVNGSEVEEISKDTIWLKDMRDIDKKDAKKEIKSIVTKEQFTNMEYKINE